jgi:hypothetical protein
MFSQLLSQPPIPLNAARANQRFPASVEQVVMRGLSKDPRQRYPDTVAFAKALEAAIGDSTVPEETGLMSRVKSLFRR